MAGSAGGGEERGDHLVLEVQDEGVVEGVEDLGAGEAPTLAGREPCGPHGGDARGGEVLDGGGGILLYMPGGGVEVGGGQMLGAAGGSKVCAEVLEAGAERVVAHVVEDGVDLGRDAVVCGGAVGEAGSCGRVGVELGVAASSTAGGEAGVREALERRAALAGACHGVVWRGGAAAHVGPKRAPRGVGRCSAACSPCRRLLYRAADVRRCSSMPTDGHTQTHACTPPAHCPRAACPRPHAFLRPPGCVYPALPPLISCTTCACVLPTITTTTTTTTIGAPPILSRTAAAARPARRPRARCGLAGPGASHPPHAGSPVRPLRPAASVAPPLLFHLQQAILHRRLFCTRPAECAGIAPRTAHTAAAGTEACIP